VTEIRESFVEVAIVFERELDNAARTAKPLVMLADCVDDVLGLFDSVRVELDE
jgi:hypothetical protein